MKNDFRVTVKPCITCRGEPYSVLTPKKRIAEEWRRETLEECPRRRRRCQVKITREVM